ncbi:MAG: hypothetical protein ACYC4F_09600 [Armatimonadota bacterium]
MSKENFNLFMLMLVVCLMLPTLGKFVVLTGSAYLIVRQIATAMLTDEEDQR